MAYDLAKTESGLPVPPQKVPSDQEKVSMSELKSLFEGRLGRTRRALDSCLLLYAMTITLFLALLAAYVLLLVLQGHTLPNRSAHSGWPVSEHTPTASTPGEKDSLSRVSASLGLIAKRSMPESFRDSDSGVGTRHKRDRPCDKTSGGGGGSTTTAVHHHWYRGKKVGSMSRAKPAANVIGLVKYINNSFGEPESILTWSSKQPLSYLREASLDPSRSKLVVHQAGIYYAFGQVSFYDPRLLYDGLQVKVNGRAVALSIVPNALVWSEKRNATGVRVTRQRSSLRFSRSKASQMPSPQVERDQKDEFRKTVSVAALVSLQVNDQLELVPACTMDTARTVVTSAGMAPTPPECTPVLYRQGGRAAIPTNYFSMFMI